MPLIKTIGCVFLFSCFCPAFSQTAYKKIGMASFYHNKFEGRRTSSGEIFSQKKLTCAHRTFPYGTRLKVTNLDNNKTVTVRVNDRGPYAKNRMIDLTTAAAQKLGFVHDGEVVVQIEIVSSEGKADSIYYTNDTLKPFFKMQPLVDSTTGYSIKIGSYLLEHKVLEVIREVKEKTGLDAYMQTMSFNKNILYRIFAGRFESKKDAREQCLKILPMFPEAYVVEMRLQEK